jgi:hypothetical protein
MLLPRGTKDRIKTWTVFPAAGKNAGKIFKTLIGLMKTKSYQGDNEKRALKAG